MEKEIELELPRGEKPKEGKTEIAEKTVELMSKMTALFEGGAFSGKAGKE